MRSRNLPESVEVVVLTETPGICEYGALPTSSNILVVGNDRRITDVVAPLACLDVGLEVNSDWCIGSSRTHRCRRRKLG